MEVSNKPFAEVITSSIAHFCAQSWSWDTFPAFGSLVEVQAPIGTLLALVYQIETGSMDPSRHPFPYQKTEAELLLEQPQIFAFLKTTFSCIVVGHQTTEGETVYYVAPEPAKIHAFVTRASVQRYHSFFAHPYYLPLLFGSSSLIFNLDEFLLALLHQQQLHKAFSRASFIEFIKTFLLLTDNDYRRLKLFLQRMHISTS